MLTISRWKILLVILVTLISAVFTAPNLMPANLREQLPAFMPKKALNLGLDLQGGSYLLYSVDTQALLAAVPKADPALRDTAAAPMGEVADPANPPPGCAFNPRCPFAVDRCRTELPALRDVGGGHLAACHRADELSLEGVTGHH